MTRAEVWSAAVARASDDPAGIALLGVCNVTPDSFSDGGDHATLDRAKRHVDALVAAGATLIDIGGESTRPGAIAVDASVQLARVLDVVRHAATRVPVSIDTRSAEVAAACLDAGAHGVNDVSMLGDPALVSVVAKYDAALILQHARATKAAARGFGGPPAEPYADVIADVARELDDARRIAIAAGVAREALFLDPGFGFGKTATDSVTLLQGFGELVAKLAGARFACGTSRKSFLRALLPTGASEDPRERLGASLASAAHLAGFPAVAILRVHDVAETRQFFAAGRQLASKARSSAS